jgi:O-antigen/teichoic acid export membrane protein
VWLTTADGEPFLESEQVDDYVVQFRYRDCVATARSDSLARFAVVLGASGVASAALAVASVARTKLVAVGLGAPGLALAGQMTLAVNVLGWISNFGGSGTARLVADALSRGDVGAAATVTRTTALLLLGAALVIVGLAAPAVTPLAVMVFGDPSAASWIVWLLAAVPLAALASLGAAVLRGAQQAGRLAAVRIAAAVMSVVACLLLVQPGDLALVVFVPLALVAANAVGMGAAAWPICRPWLSVKGPWFAAGVARRVAADGLANVFMGLTTSAAMLAVGRQYLAAGDLDTAGRIVALAWFSEPLAAAFVAGHSASTYPAYAAARGPAADAVLARGVRGLVVVAVPVLAVVAIAAGPIVGVAFSPALADVAALVPLMALAAYVRSATMVLGMPLLARGRLIALSTIHAGWALAIAMGALGFAAPGLAGASAFVRAYVLATLVQAVVLVGVLRRSGLHAGGSDLAWLASGAAPLIWLALAR